MICFFRHSLAQSTGYMVQPKAGDMLLQLSSLMVHLGLLMSLLSTTASCYQLFKVHSRDVSKQGKNNILLRRKMEPNQVLNPFLLSSRSLFSAASAHPCLLYSLFHHSPGLA